MGEKSGLGFGFIPPGRLANPPELIALKFKPIITDLTCEGDFFDRREGA
jgi:hypothetical protein